MISFYARRNGAQHVKSSLFILSDSDAEIDKEHAVMPVGK